MWVRMSTFRGTPDQSDDEVARQTKVLQEQVLPAARQMDGYRGVISLGDRSSGKAVSLTFWESEEAMRASEEAANKLREQAAAATHDEIAGVERFEVYIQETPQA